MEGRARWVVGRATYSGKKDLFCGVIPSLKKMLGTMLKDKKNTEKTIEELDWHKRNTLKTTWEKPEVNG